MSAATPTSWPRLIGEVSLCIGSGVVAFVLMNFLWQRWTLFALVISGFLAMGGGAGFVPRRTPALLKNILVWMTIGVALAFLWFLASLAR
jgi:hypothetical protein